MNKKTKALYEERARIIKAMGHPTRLFIVEKLSESQQCVRDLTKMIGADISTVSKHLSVLKNAGIISDEKRGLNVYYSLRVPCILNFFGCVESLLKANAESNLELLKK